MNWKFRSKEGEVLVKKSRITLVFLVMFSLLFASSQFVLAKEWDFQTIKDVNKVWKVRFNIPLNPASLTADSVYITDGKSKHATTLRSIGNGYEVEVAPSVPYEMGKQYRLMITAAVKSKGGIALKTPIDVPFQVVDSKAKVQSVHSITGDILTNFTVMTNREVHRVTINGINMHYKGNNTYTYTLIDTKPGTVVTVIGYDENNKKLETKQYKTGGAGF